MAYEKQTWANGDLITAEKLNHMEDGIDENSVFVVEYDEDASESSATFEETLSAYNNGKTLVAIIHKNSAGSQEHRILWDVKLSGPSYPGINTIYFTCIEPVFQAGFDAMMGVMLDFQSDGSVFLKKGFKSLTT